MNLTQSIRALSIRIEAADSDEERETRLSELFTLIDSSSDVIKRPMEIARQMKEINPRPHRLHSLIDEVMSEVDIRGLSPARIEAPIPHDIVVLVDRDLILEAFRNIIHNAMKAMPDGGALIIDGALSDDGWEARITFADTGVGIARNKSGPLIRLRDHAEGHGARRARLAPATPSAERQPRYRKRSGKRNHGDYNFACGRVMNRTYRTYRNHGTSYQSHRSYKSYSWAPRIFRENNMKLRTLIVEDDKYQADAISYILQATDERRMKDAGIDGFEITVVNCAADARKALDRAGRDAAAYDLLLLDLGLPENP